MDYTSLGQQIANAAEITDLGTTWGQRLWLFDASEQFGTSLQVHADDQATAKAEAAVAFARLAERAGGNVGPLAKGPELVPVTAAAGADLVKITDNHPDGPLWRATTQDEHGVQVMLHADDEPAARAVLHNYLEEVVAANQ